MNWVTLTIEPWMPIGADKAKEDFAKIAKDAAFNILPIDRAHKKVDLSQLAAGDLLIHQYPSYLGDDWELNFQQESQQKGILFGMLIHDFEPLRQRAQAENAAAYELIERADFLIVHNQHMQQALADRNDRIFQIGLFDYLSNPQDRPHAAIKSELVYAGSLAKAAWLKHYALGIPLTVFGRIPRTWDFLPSPDMQIKKAVDPEILPRVLPAAWGLVWDEDLNPDKTRYQVYEKINSPHKLSLYLAAEIPVIVWEQAAIADFVARQHLGLAVSQLADITPAKLASCQIDFKQLSSFSKKIRQGFFTRQLLQTILNNKKAIQDGCHPK